MKVIYIASPYTIGDVAENVHRQLEASHRILDMGQCPVAPLLSHHLHIHRQRGYQDWINMDLALIPKMDAILRLEGESKGADNEVRLAVSLGIPVFHDWQSLTHWIETQNK